MNKKGDFPSLVFAVITIFMIGTLFFVFSHMSDKFYDKLDNYLDSNAEYNNTEAETAIEKISSVEQSIWDYGFVAILFGVIISLLLTAYATRISVVFFWVYGVLAIVVLVLGVMISNMWQEMAASPEFTETIARFPITDAILGNNYPMVVAGIIFLMMIVLFGKSPDEAGGLGLR